MCVGGTLFCGTCGNPEATGRTCNLCGFALPKKAPQISAVEKDLIPESQSRSWGFLSLGVVAFFGWLVFMGSPIWGQATSWMVISMPADMFADSIGRGLLLQYKLSILGFSTALLGVSTFGFIKFFKT